MTRTVLCFGDSNTHGTMPMATLGDRERFGPEARWPGVMRACLGAGLEVIEEGHPGRTTVHPDPIEGVHKNGIAVLPALLESHRPIDLVIVMLGTNDLKQRFAVGPFDIALSVAKICEAIAVSDAGPEGAAPKVLAVSPVPIEERGVLAEMFAGGRAVGLALAEALTSLAPCPVFDAGSVATVDPLDGVHLDAGAHRAIGEAMAREVETLMGGPDAERT